MSLFDQLATDLTEIAADAAGPALDATYTARDNRFDPVALKLVFERGAAGERDGSDGKTRVGEATAHIPTASVRDVRLFDTLTLAAIATADEQEVWSIERILEQNPALTVCNCVLLQRTRLVTTSQERKR